MTETKYRLRHAPDGRRLTLTAGGHADPVGAMRLGRFMLVEGGGGDLFERAAAERVVAAMGPRFEIVAVEITEKEQ